MLQFLVESEDKLRKGQTLSGMGLCVHTIEGMKSVGKGRLSHVGTAL